MNKTELLKYARTPLRQQSNRVWRTYTGGALIDRWKKITPESDGSLPEEWIMSTISARGKNRPPNEGLSIIETPEGLVNLVITYRSRSGTFSGRQDCQTVWDNRSADKNA